MAKTGDDNGKGKNGKTGRKGERQVRKAGGGYSGPGRGMVGNGADRAIVVVVPPVVVVMEGDQQHRIQYRHGHREGNEVPKSLARWNRIASDVVRDVHHSANRTYFYLFVKRGRSRQHSGRIQASLSGRDAMVPKRAPLSESKNKMVDFNKEIDHGFVGSPSVTLSKTFLPTIHQQHSPP